MARRPVLVDVTRLLTRLRFRAPTGIDRVDLAYARRFLDGSADRRAVVLTPFGARLLPPDRCAALLATLTVRWAGEAGGAEPADARDGQDLARLRAWLGAAPSTPSPPPMDGRRTGRIAPILGRAGTVRNLALQRAEAAAPRGAIYLHTSHLRLDRPDRFAWLDGRPDIEPVFFVHDLIPIEYPEYAVPGEAERHRVRIATIAARGIAAITNSQDVADRFSAYLARHALRHVPATAAALGVEPSFRPDPVPVAASRPYFVACSTIEARKNHLLLLQIWRELARSLGPRTPALVIVGRRGWESESATDLLDRCEVLRPHVIETSGLPTPDLATLVAGAHALLMPSFAEGYGIPVAEALAVGTPAIASDLPAHREVAGGHATLLDPLDGPGWRAAILAEADRPRGGRAATSFRAPDWDGHFRIVDHVLASLPGERSGRAHP